MGELIAAAAIELCGWKTLLTPMDHIDLVAMRGTRFMRVQVKASSLIEGTDRKPHYRFATRDKHLARLDKAVIDIVALVAIDTRRVVFRVTDSLSKTTRVLPSKYDVIDIERITWDNAVTKILGEDHGVLSRPEVA